MGSDKEIENGLTRDRVQTLCALSLLCLMDGVLHGCRGREAATAIVYDVALHLVSLLTGHSNKQDIASFSQQNGGVSCLSVRLSI